MSSKDNTVSRFLNEKSPFLYENKFNLSLKDYPLNPILLPIPLDNKLLEYETSSLEVLHRWSNLQNLNNQVDLDSILEHELSLWGNEDKRNYDETSVLDELGLNDVVPGYILDEAKKIGAPKKDIAPKVADVVTIAPSSDNQIRNNWLKMTKEQRINAYMDYIRDSFVDCTTLVNPIKPNLKQKKVYKVMPNVESWKNCYIQAGISGGLAEIDRGDRGFIRLAQETSTTKSYEYYHSVGTEGDGERFSFIRNYTSQRATKKDGNENYYLLSLSTQLYKNFLDKTEKKQPTQIVKKGDKDTKGDIKTSEHPDNDVIYILSIKGQKSVLTKAGGGKKNDYVITYEDDEMEGE